MGKQSGLGDNFYIAGYDLSGDVASLDQISGGPATLDVTGLNKSANERIGGIRDGDMQFTTYFDTATEHPALSVLPTSSVIASYLRGTAQGNAAACMIGRQINYDGTRDATGNLTMKVEVQADHYGLEWGAQLTSGIYSGANFLTGQNAGFEGGIGTWVHGVNVPTVAESSAHAHTGSDSLSMTSTTSGNMGAMNAATGSAGVAVTPGAKVYAQAWYLAGSTARTVQIGVNWYTSGAVYISTSINTGVADNTSTWTLTNGAFAAPATAAYALIVTQVAAVAGASEVHYVDDVELIALPASYDTGIGTLFTGNASTFEGGIANWIHGTNCTVAQSASAAHSGTHSLALTSAASGEMDASSATAASISSQGIPVTGGGAYYAGGWFLAAATPQSVQAGVNWYTSAGSLVSSSTVSSVTDSTTTWALSGGTVTAPATAAYARVYGSALSTSAISEVHYLDDVVFFPAFGAQAYLQVTAFTGTDCTVTLQDSADGVTWANVTGLAFTQITAVPASQRLAIANGTALRRYVTASVSSTGGFTALSFAVVLVKNQVQVSF